jgi:hypothetical protein
MSRDNRDGRGRKFLPEIEVEVANDGSAKISVGDGSGKSCVDLTADLEQALGGGHSRELTSGYHKQPKTVQRQSNREQQR